MQVPCLWTRLPESDFCYVIMGYDLESDVIEKPQRLWSERLQMLQSLPKYVT